MVFQRSELIFNLVLPHLCLNRLGLGDKTTIDISYSIVWIWIFWNLHKTNSKNSTYHDSHVFESLADKINILLFLLTFPSSYKTQKISVIQRSSNTDYFNVTFTIFVNPPI